MLVRVLEVLGRDRAFELFEYLILFFILTSLATLTAVLVYQLRSRRALRKSNERLEKVVGYLGRSLFGEGGWRKVEQTAATNGRRLDSLVSLLDPASFEEWASDRVARGLIDVHEADELRERITQPPELSRSIGGGDAFSEVIPTSGMPIAVRQGEVNARGTIAEVGENAFSVWLIDGDEELREDEPVTLLLLSRSGPFTFAASLRKDDDGTLIVERPGRIVRTQRRRFERRPASLATTVKEYLGADTLAAEATISELSGGGATVSNPNHEFDVGNVLTMSFFAGSRHYTVAGRVVRTSANDDRLHVRFEAMKDQQREEIATSLKRIDLG